MRKDPSIKVNTRKYNVKKFLDLLNAEKEIHKFDLIEALDISESTYEKLKPFMEYWHGDKVFYDKSLKYWKWVS